MKQCNNCDKDSVCLLKESHEETINYIKSKIDFKNSLFDFVDVGIMCQFYDNRDGKIQGVNIISEIEGGINNGL